MNMIPTMLTVHCTDTTNGLRAEVETIRQDHIKNRGFTDIGYNCVIQPDGEICPGRPLNVVGAHTEGHNENNVGVALVGSSKFTARQFDALLSFIGSVMQSYPVKPWSIYVHNQWDTAIKQGKTCPNFSINKLMYFVTSHDIKALQDVIMEEK